MTARSELWCICGSCKWTWTVYSPLPAPLEVVARAMKNARCPNCPPQARPKIFMATDADIEAARAKQDRFALDPIQPGQSEISEISITAAVRRAGG